MADGIDDFPGVDIDRIHFKKGITMAEGINGSGASYLAMEDAKKMYMERVYNMSHGELFSELMRVHTESSRLLTQAQNEIARLKELLGDDFSNSEA